MFGIGFQVVQSKNFAFPPTIDVVMLEVIDEFHDGMVNIGGISDVENDRFARWEPGQFALEADEIGEDGGSSDADSINTLRFMLYVIGNLQQVLDMNPARQSDDELEQDTDQYPDQQISKQDGEDGDGKYQQLLLAYNHGFCKLFGGGQSEAGIDQ